MCAEDDETVWNYTFPTVAAEEVTMVPERSKAAQLDRRMTWGAPASCYRLTGIPGLLMGEGHMGARWAWETQIGFPVLLLPEHETLGR